MCTLGLCHCDCKDFGYTNGDVAQFNKCKKWGRSVLEDTLCYDRIPEEQHAAYEELVKKRHGTPTDQSAKNDKGKLRWDLLPLHLVEQTVRVLTYGTSKYGPNTWQTIENAGERYYAALMRHIVAYRNGETIDPESGISHLAHAVCNLIFMDYCHDKD